MESRAEQCGLMRHGEVLRPYSYFNANITNYTAITLIVAATTCNQQVHAVIKSSMHLTCKLRLISKLKLEIKYITE